MTQLSMQQGNATTPVLPGPQGLVSIIRGVRKYGFLDYSYQLWQEHGDLFQLSVGGRDMIFGIHPDTVRHVTITNRTNYDKLGSYDRVRQYVLGQGLVTSRGDLWRRQRKLMAPFYTPRGVSAYAGIFLRDALALADRWEQVAGTGEQVEMDEEMIAVTASIILRTMFSMEASEEITEMKHVVETMIGYVSTGNGIMNPLPLWVPTKLNREYKHARTQVNNYINGLIAQRRAMPEDEWPDDLFARLMRARDEETGEVMSESLLRDESITTFFAGHETTARTMTYAWYALATHPEAMAKLQAELDTVLGGRRPTYEDLHNLPYTLQVIKETLRLYPPAPFYIRDAVGDDTLSGYHVPAGGSVMLSPYLTHRHPEFWPDPLRFDPDRWAPEAEAERHPQAYHPFASGQRVCIGNNFSLLESHILLAVLAQRFAPQMIAGFTPKFKMMGTLGTTNGMPMTITRR